MRIFATAAALSAALIMTPTAFAAPSPHTANNPGTSFSTPGHVSAGANWHGGGHRGGWRNGDPWSGPWARHGHGPRFGDWGFDGGFTEIEPTPVIVQAAPGHSTGIVRSYNRFAGSLTLTDGEYFAVPARLSRMVLLPGERVIVAWQPSAGPPVANRVTIIS